MAKSNAALEREIKAAARIWNENGSKNPHDQEHEVASAIYHTLLWARGRREEYPSIRVQKHFDKKG
jgi:hypothetical protein